MTKKKSTAMTASSDALGAKPERAVPPSKKIAAAPGHDVVNTKKRSPKVTRAPFEIAGQRVTAGKRMRTELPIGNLMRGTPAAFPPHAVHGTNDGPLGWMTAPIHVDATCGPELLHHVLGAISAPAPTRPVIRAPDAEST